MILVSWTLAGPGTAPIIGDALRSVAPLVDMCLVVWTGSIGEEERPLFREACAVPCDLAWHLWQWRNDYGAARNAALDYVGARVTDWSVMIDTDERVICHDPEALRAWLDALPEHVQVVVVHHEDGSHTRERFFRMPARYRFAGRVHEMYPCPENEQAIAPPALIRWSELPKTREELRAKFARDAHILTHDIRANPKNGAAHYYLGVSLQSLALYAREDGDDDTASRLFHDAIDVYREHRNIDTSGAPAWHEGTAFSCYRAAECYLALGEPNRAIDCAVAGLALDAGIAELYWIAGIASLQEGRHEQARAWAESAIAHRLKTESEQRRKGFRIPRALTTGPYELLAATRNASGAIGAAERDRMVARGLSPDLPLYVRPMEKAAR